jgi:hypothetical protein
MLTTVDLMPSVDCVLNFLIAFIVRLPLLVLIFSIIVQTTLMLCFYLTRGAKYLDAVVNNFSIQISHAKPMHMDQ